MSSSLLVPKKLWSDFMKRDNLLQAIASPTPPLRYTGGIANSKPSITLYCVKCRSKRQAANAQTVTMKNGKPATKGLCMICGTGMYKIGALSGQAPTFVPMEEEIDTPGSLYDYLNALPIK